MAEDQEDEIDDVFINYEFDVRLIRIIEDTFVPSWLHVTAEVVPLPDKSERDLEVAMSKIDHWINKIVTKAIAFSRSNESAILTLIDAEGNNRTGNKLMLTPFEPSDDHLATLFQAKLTALAAGTLQFGAVEVRSDNMLGLTFTFAGMAEDYLPDIDDWVGERRYFDEPWWDRDDASMLDTVPDEDADLSVKPSWAFKLDFLADNPERNAVIVRPNFNPKIIEGGRDDDDE